MTPTLFGRLQTRLLVSLGFGVPVALCLALASPASGGRSHTAATNVMLLGMTIAFGCLWELCYHAMQQLRAERDWPSGLSLVLGVPELFIVHRTCEVMELIPTMSLQRFVATTAVIWSCIWLAGQSAMRVLHPMWRFRGGRLF